MNSGLSIGAQPKAMTGRVAMIKPLKRTHFDMTTRSSNEGAVPTGLLNGKRSSTANGSPAKHEKRIESAMDYIERRHDLLMLLLDALIEFKVMRMYQQYSKLT